MAVKTCFVSSCSNNSEHKMNTLFIMVPIKEDIRMKWCVAVSRLESDMLKWMEYKLIGSRVYMREDVIPHKFINSPKPTEQVMKSQFSSSSRKRRSESLGKLGDKVKRKFGFHRPSMGEATTVTPQSSLKEEVTTNEFESLSGKFLEFPVDHLCGKSVSADCGREFNPEIIYYEPEQTPMFSDKKIQVNIRPSKRSIRIGTSISVRSIGTNTMSQSFQKPHETPLTTTTLSSSESSLMNSSSKSVNFGNHSESSSVLSAIVDLRRSKYSNVIKRSRFHEALLNGAHVMADRGFKQISSLLSPKQCELIRPPSVSTSQISFKEEVREGKRIAALRIHIERVIRRLREFKILKMHS